jgi:peptidoglycan/LPS O-acetylase OafA/YrhL
LHSPTGGTPEHFFVYAHPTYKQLLFQSSLIQPPNAMLLGVMWSLPYEVEMYLLLPALFFFVQRNFSLWPLLVIWELVLVNSRHVPANTHNFAVAMGYFLPGIMAYVGFGRFKALLPGWTLMPFLVAMWLLFLYRYDYHRGWYFCLIIGMTLPLFRQMKSKWVLEPSRVLAKYSYGIYLTHSFAIVVGMYLLRGHSPEAQLLAELIVLVVLPVVAYHLLEHPMIRLGSRLAAKAEARYEQRELRQYRETPAA